jgi:hypothetical protein
MSLATARIPAALASGLICLALGAGAGASAMTYYGYHWQKDESAPTGPGAGPQQPDGKGRPEASTEKAGQEKGGQGKGGFGKGGGGGGPGGGFGGGRGPAGPKTQLAGLVSKLDQLLSKSLTLDLSAEQKKKVLAQIKGLADAEDLSDADAQKRLDALVATLGDRKVTFESAGYRWPGGSAPAAPAAPPPPNPFKDPANQKHLKSLDAQLTKDGDK